MLLSRLRPSAPDGSAPASARLTSVAILLRRHPFVAVAGVMVTAAVLVSLLPSEWSLVDDPRLKTELSDNIAQHGLLGGVWAQVVDSARYEQGQFRPLAWIYWSTFYLASPSVAHGMRAAMFIAAILIPPLVASRRPDDRVDGALFVWGACLLLVNGTLYQGLTLLSLTELTGVAVIALGMAIANPIGRAILWLAAGLLRTPFIWLAAAWGAVLAVKGPARALGRALVAAGVLVVAAAIAFAGSGAYTAGYASSLGQIQTGLRTSLPLFGWPLVLAILGLVAFRPDPRRFDWRDQAVTVFVAGGLGYYATVLPWGAIGAYHTAPVIWMLSVAFVFFIGGARIATERPTVASADGRMLARLVTSVAILASVAAAARLAWLVGGYQSDRVSSIMAMRDWALSLPSQGVVLGVNGKEAALTIEKIAQLSDPDWQNQVVHVADDDDDATVSYYIRLHENGSGNPRLEGDAIRTLPLITIYRP